jgi:hypothetical protein
MPEARSYPDANVRAQCYFVAHANTQCWHCGSSTRVLALVLPRDHETLEADEQKSGAGDEVEAWQYASVGALLFHVERLNDQVLRRLNGISPHYRRSYCPGDENAYWANHCEHCEKLLDDQELHCELNGAFVPSSEIAASHIQLQKIQEPLAAAAAGYSFEPDFFEFVRRV